LLHRQADLLDQSSDAILALRIDGRGIVYWNRGAQRLYGYTAAEAEGRRTHELLQTRAPVPIEDIRLSRTGIAMQKQEWYIMLVAPGR
jgi:PAS domain S-box-containing protein